MMVERKMELEISTHAPLAGRDPKAPPRGKSYTLFQPTRPLRGATATATS